MTWETELIRFFGYHPLKSMSTSETMVYKARTKGSLAVAKIACSPEYAEDLQEERDRLAENQDLEWMPRLIRYQDYLGSTPEEDRILELFHKEGWTMSNPVILLKEFTLGVSLSKFPGAKLNGRQYLNVRHQVDEMHSRNYAGLDIVPCNILVQGPTLATLFDLGPSLSAKSFSERKYDDVMSLASLLQE
ncbi:hypothetical protein J4438_02760 [Candidatus Woesearchaeota archaeon]|nr:hypothetical protein [Candidatus Woesearchaeota archaeon]